MTIPTTAAAFKAWAHNECGKWPAKLQIKAHEAWFSMLMLGTIEPDPQAEFIAEYREWEKQS